VVEEFPGLLFALVFFGSRSNVKMNVNVNVKMTNDWARRISGLGASLTLIFSKFPANFLMNVCTFP